MSRPSGDRWKRASNLQKANPAKRICPVQLDEVAEHRLATRHPMTVRDDGRQETAKELLIGDEPVPPMAADLLRAPHLNRVRTWRDAVQPFPGSRRRSPE